MAEFFDAEDDATARGGLHELGVDVDRIGLRVIRVFGREIRARSSEDQADSVAAMGLSGGFQCQLRRVLMMKLLEKTDSPPHQSHGTIASNWSSLPATGVTFVAWANELVGRDMATSY